MAWHVALLVWLAMPHMHRILTEIFHSKWICILYAVCGQAVLLSSSNRDVPGNNLHPAHPPCCSEAFVRSLILLITALLCAAVFLWSPALYCFGDGEHNPDDRYVSNAVTGPRSQLVERGFYKHISGFPILSPGLKSAGNTCLLTGYSLKALITGAYTNGRERPGDSRGEQRFRLFRNSLVLLNGHLEGSAHGALGEGNTSAEGNSLTIDGAYTFITGRPPLPFTVSLTGGLALNVRNNILTIRSGAIVGDVAGAYGFQSALSNRAILEGGTVEGQVIGGGCLDGPSSENLVLMTGGTVKELVGGSSIQSGIATQNSVFFSGGRTTGITGGLSRESHANGNTIFISGGVVAPSEETREPAYIIGGRSLRASATNNRINLSGKPDLQGCVFLGGAADTGRPANQDQDIISGNILLLEADYQGPLPAAYNFESLVVQSKATVIPRTLHTFPGSLNRLVVEGALHFINPRQGRLHFTRTQYAGKHGSIEIRVHTGKQIHADKIVFEHGSLVLDPVRIHLRNPQDLKPGVPVLVMEVDNASTMREVNRRYAMAWAEEPRLSEAETGKYEIRLFVSLGGDDKDHWIIEKRPLNRKKQARNLGGNPKIVSRGRG